MAEKEPPSSASNENARLKLIVDALPAFVAYISPQGIFQFANEAYRRWFGKEPSEVVGKHQREILGGHAYEIAQPYIERTIQTGKPVSYLNEIVDRDGNHRTIAATYIPELDHSGRVVGFIVLGLDDTQRKIAEDQARITENRFREHFEQAPNSIQIFAPDGRTLAVNRSWKRLWNISDDVIENYILKSYNILNDPELEAKGLLPYIKKAFQGEATDIPTAFYDPTNIDEVASPKWVEAYIYPVKDSQGRITEVVLTHRDVTEKKNSEQALHEAIRARDEFLSIASHELKTPLTSVRLQTQMQLRKLNKDPERVRDLANLNKYFTSTDVQMERISRLIEDMLDISRIANGRLDLQIEACDLSKLVHRILHQMEDHFASAGSSFQTHIQEGIVGDWDPFRLEQVVINLITNAIKYGNGKPVHVNLTRSTDDAILEIRDEGMGIAQENLERIFERFERAVSSKNISGLGLGLYISRQIAISHGGSISADSELGKGSTFTVTLPFRFKSN